MNAKANAEVSYAHRSRIEKLGVKRGHRVLFAGLGDPAFRAEVEHAGAHVSTRATGEADLIFLGADDRAGLSRLRSLHKNLKRDGAIWVIRPRGSGAISESDVMAAGKAVGLVDIKVARFSDTHSALKFVIPVSRR